MKIVDVKLCHTGTGYRLHVRSSIGPLSLCRRRVFGSTDSHFLLETKAEPLSVKLPDGTIYWGPQSEIKVDGVRVCTTCLRRLRKQNR